MKTFLDIIPPKMPFEQDQAVEQTSFTTFAAIGLLIITLAVIFWYSRKYTADN